MEKVIDLFEYCEFIGLKGVKKDEQDTGKPCRKQISAYWHYLQNIADERVEAVKPKLQGKFFPSAPELKELITSSQAINGAYNAEKISEVKQLADPSQECITAAEWRRRQVNQPPKCEKGEDGYFRANQAWMLQKIEEGKNKYGRGGSFEGVAKELGLISTTTAWRFSTPEEAKQELESRSPELQAKINQLAEIKQKIVQAETWFEANQNLRHEIAEKAEQRFSALVAQCNQLEEELNSFGVCA